MSLNDTPSGERAHIVFFGVRNAGKSSLVNALTNQTVSVVSDVAGTTTDPVRKAMELAPAGPVLVIDTPGIDDAGDVGDLRVQRAEAALNEADVAVLVMDATCGMTAFDERLIAAFQARRIPYVIAENKADLLVEEERAGSSDQPSLFEPGKILCPTAAPESSECLCASLREEDGASEGIVEGVQGNRDASLPLNARAREERGGCGSEAPGSASLWAARVRVSARTGEGLDDLKRALDDPTFHQKLLEEYGID